MTKNYLTNGNKKSYKIAGKVYESLDQIGEFYKRSKPTILKWVNRGSTDSGDMIRVVTIVKE